MSDLVYFLLTTGFVKYATSCLQRIMSKIVVDFTALMLYRNSYELGGFYFSLTIFLNQVGCWVCACFYLSYYNGANKIDPTTIYVCLGALNLLLVLCLLIFFRIINPEYISSFFSFESGRQNAKACFENNIEDAARITIFTTNIDLLREIAPDVKAWTLSNWSRWDSEKPE